VIPVTNAGFSTGAPWLPVQRAASTYNVAREQADPNSIYAWYRALLKLRHDHPAFRDGAYIPLDSANPNVFVFARKAGANLALIAMNTSPEKQNVTVHGLPGAWPPFRQTLLASPAAQAPATESFSIEPFGVIIAATE